jgi:catechol 2,3-dioxygenase-like lactoylglutathione lyase family enzyme
MAEEKEPPFPSPEDYGRSLKGIGVNLLVRDVQRMVAFATQVIGAKALYADNDFAALRYGDSEFMLHSDHAYRDNAVVGLVQGLAGRGAGVEIRVYGCDPDAAEARARDGGWTVLAGSIDKPHGLRECVLVDDEGYVWVPGMALPSGTTR